MDLSNFEGCCGAKIILAFDEDDNLDKVDLPNQERQLTQLIDDAKKGSRYSDGAHAGVIFAILADKAQKKAQAMLLKHGFKVVLKFKNPNSGNMLTSYVLDLTKKPRKRAASKKTTRRAREKFMVGVDLEKRFQD